MNITRIASSASIASATALSLALAAPASAAEVVLTFDGLACSSTNSGAVDRQCSTNGDRIGNNYGTTSLVTISSAIVPGATGAGSNLFHYETTAFGGVGPGVYGFNNSSRETASSITFTPAAGYELSILDFRYFRSNSTSLRSSFEIVDAAGTQLFTETGSGGTVTVNTAFSSGPLTFLFYSERGNPVVADLRYDVRAVGASTNPGAVPEPATWAMMIGGFGLVGGAMRRRVNTRSVAC